VEGACDGYLRQSRYRALLPERITLPGFGQILGRAVSTREIRERIRTDSI
jgi:hypothetical protein